MALIKCPECKNQVSDAAEICPHCGYALKLHNGETEKSERFPKWKGIRLLEKKNNIKIFAGIVAGCIVLVGIFLVFHSGSAVSKAKSYYQNNDIASFREMKKTFSDADMEKFNSYLAEETEKRYREFSDGKIEYSATIADMKTIERFSDKTDEIKKIEKDLSSL